MQLNLFQKSLGTIFSKRAQANAKGKVLTINVIQSEKNVDSGYNRITSLCFDEYGFRLLFSDHKGSIFLFNFKDNKYTFVVNCSQACTALAFGLKPLPKNEFYVALIDNSFKAFDLGENQWVSQMRGHTTCIRNISVHQDGELALTYSANAAIIWNVLSFTKIRQLSVNCDTGITQVFFLSNQIISCFRDDSIFIWDYQTLECKVKLPPPSDNKVPLYRSLACSCDGRLLAAAGKSHFIDVWNLDCGTLRQTIELPKPIVGVRKLLFLEPNRIDSDGQETLLAVLGEDRKLRLIQLSTCRLLVDFSFDDVYGYSVTDGCPGDPLVLTMSTGSKRADKLAVVAATAGNLHLYDLGAVWKEANKPELPIRKVWKKAKSGRSGSSTYRRENKDLPSDADSDTNDTDNTKILVKVDDCLATPTSILNKRKLRGILREYGKFPGKYRSFIWRGLMQLPGNVSVLTALLDKGVHSSWELLPQKYPIRSQKLTRCLQRILSALSYWSPLFAECDFLPFLAFPFVKVFQNNLLLAFEMVITVLLNWARDWFEYFPNPPINVLCVVENVLAHHDRELYQHFVDLRVTTEVYAWPLMETVFSEVLTKEEWLSLWDNLVCRHPGFFLLCIVSYSLCAKSPLLRVNNIEEIESFYRHQGCISAVEILRRAYALDTITPSDIHPSKLTTKFEPLTKGQYPLFQKYPKFIVDHQIRERERIREEEKDYLRQRAEAEEMQRKTEIHVAQEQSWYRQQEMLSRAEERRKLMIVEEESKLREQKKRLNILMEKLKMKEAEVMQNARKNIRKFEVFQEENDKDARSNRISNSCLGTVETSAFEETEMAIQEAEFKIKRLEIELEKRRDNTKTDEQRHLTTAHHYLN